MSQKKIHANQLTTRRRYNIPCSRSCITEQRGFRRLSRDRGQARLL